MTVKLLFFAQCADWMKTKEMNLDVSHPLSLRDALCLSPALSPLKGRRSYLKVALNREFADDNAEVNDGDEIAFFPPFSGG